MAHPRFEAAKAAFDKAKKDTAVLTSQKVCGQGGCMARGLYVETFRGDRYHFEGTCDAGHLTERYGYAEQEVKA